jgi:hypothetical protein
MATGIRCIFGGIQELLVPIAPAPQVSVDYLLDAPMRVISRRCPAGLLLAWPPNSL